MNVSMQDTFNLGWKLASVIRGALHPQILETYQQERLPVAERLIALDKRICRGMCSRRNADGETFHGAFDEDHKRALEEENSSASGLAVIYQPNLLVTSVAHHQTTNLRIGARIPSMLIINQSDAQPRHLQHILPSTGEWSLIIFGGDIADPRQMQRLNHLEETLCHPESIIQRLNNHASAMRRDSAFVRIYLIHCAERLRIELHDLPAVFRPWTEDNGVDYSRVWVDEKAYHHAGGGQLYKSFGIGPEGCMVLLRPDQHLSFLSDMDDGKGLKRFLTSITPEESHQSATFQDL